MKDKKNQNRGLERVSHFFLSAPKPPVEKERVTIQVAARILGVSKGTIINYLNRGLLTRIKEDGRIYIEMDEVRSLSDYGKKLPVPSGAHPSSERERGTTSLPKKDPSKQALTPIGYFKKEHQVLPTASQEPKHRELERLKSELDNLRQSLQAQTSELAETSNKLKELEKEHKRRQLNFHKATEGHPRPGPENSGKKKMVLFTILSLLGVLILSVWWSNRFSTQPPSPESYSPTIEASASLQESVSPFPEKNRQDLELAPTPAVHVLRAETLARTWLRVIIDDRQELEYLLNPDEKHTWRAVSGFRLHIGNAAGIQLYLNDQPLKALGESGEVVLLQLPDSSLIANSSSEHK